MRTMSLTLDKETHDALSKIAWSLRKRRSTAATFLFERGLTAMEQSARSWEGPDNEGTLRQLEVIRSDTADTIRELMDIEGKIASFGFAVFEAYRGMSNALMAYSGKKAKAERLVSILRERGIAYDLTPGLAPNYDRLASEYLFRDNADEKKGDEQSWVDHGVDRRRSEEKHHPEA